MHFALEGVSFQIIYNKNNNLYIFLPVQLYQENEGKSGIEASDAGRSGNDAGDGDGSCNTDESDSSEVIAMSKNSSEKNQFKLKTIIY